MIIGFTGTRYSMTDAQRAAFGVLVMLDMDFQEFHHGSCQGADVEAATGKGLPQEGDDRP